MDFNSLFSSEILFLLVWFSYLSLSMVLSCSLTCWLSEKIRSLSSFDEVSLLIISSSNSFTLFLTWISFLDSSSYNFSTSFLWTSLFYLIFNNRFSISWVFSWFTTTRFLAFASFFSNYWYLTEKFDINCYFFCLYASLSIASLTSFNAGSPINIPVKDREHELSWASCCKAFKLY